MPELPRPVIREHRFERELRALIRHARDADAFVEAAEFVLARDPLVGQETAHPPVWTLTMPLVGATQIVLYYAFDESTVWLLSIAAL